MAAILMAAALYLMLPLVAFPAPGIRTCQNKACKKAGAADTLETLFTLASASREASAGAQAESSLAAVQSAFAASRVEASGCLGKCGSGPNCVSTEGGPEDIFHDVYKPAACTALLEEIGVHVPEAAQKAWLRRMYAKRAMQCNKHDEAVALLTQAYAPPSLLLFFSRPRPRCLLG